ncbi:MAG: YtxH domain-containing protein [Patescibacteria group bacterium]
MSKDNSTAKKVAIGGVIAAAAGYVAGILTAPKSGKETRADIKDAAEKTMAEAEKDLKNLHTELDKIIKQAKARSEKLSSKAQKELSQLIDKAKDTKEKAREMLSALHEGGAEDKDLAKAIKDANNALEHLRDYLKK